MYSVTNPSQHPPNPKLCSFELFIVNGVGGGKSKMHLNVVDQKETQSPISSRIDSNESIPLAYVAWRAATSNRVVLPVLPGLQIRALVFVALGPEFKRIPAQKTQLDLRLSYGSVHDCI